MNRLISTFAFALVAATSAFAHLATDPATQDLTKRKWWMPRFEEKKSIAAKGGYPVVFIGDSITHHLDKKPECKAVWDKYFADGEYKALNVGFSADRTEHVLWRLKHGQLDGLRPRALVLMIGTNNTGHRPAEEESALDTFLGIRAIIEDLDVRFPKAYKIICPIFPRGASTADPLRIRNDRVNQALLSYVQSRSSSKLIVWCDAASQLTDEHGNLSKEIAPDLLHPSPAGHEICAKQVLRCLDYAFGKTKDRPSCVRPADGKTSIDYNLLPKACFAEPKTRWINGMRKSAKGKIAKMNERMLQKRDAIQKKANHHYDLVMVGDSITHRWESRHGDCESYVQLTNRYDVLNVGFGGDNTGNVIWNALYGGMLDGYTCDTMMLMIGTNNRDASAEEVAEGIKASIAALRLKQPKAKIILTSIIPWKNTELGNKLNEKNKKTNAIIKNFADGETIVYLDLYDKFLNADGTTNEKFFDDRAHPSPAGYRVWFDALMPVLAMPSKR